MENIFLDGILTDRVAFVTGGGTGITGGVARALAEAGANVALVSRSIEHLEPAAKAINDARARGSGPTVMEGSGSNVGEAFAVAADVRNPEEVEKAIAAAVERFGKIDVVVNGAAGNFLAPAEALSQTDSEPSWTSISRAPSTFVALPSRNLKNIRARFSTLARRFITLARRCNSMYPPRRPESTR